MRSSLGDASGAILRGRWLSVDARAAPLRRRLLVVEHGVAKDAVAAMPARLRGGKRTEREHTGLLHTVHI